LCDKEDRGQLTPDKPPPAKKSRNFKMADYMDWSEDFSDASLEHDVERYLRDKVRPLEPNQL